MHGEQIHSFVAAGEASSSSHSRAKPRESPCEHGYGRCFQKVAQVPSKRIRKNPSHKFPNTKHASEPIEGCWTLVRLSFSCISAHSAALARMAFRPQKQSSLSLFQKTPGPFCSQGARIGNPPPKIFTSLEPPGRDGHENAVSVATATGAFSKAHSCRGGHRGRAEHTAPALSTSVDYSKTWNVTSSTLEIWNMILYDRIKTGPGSHFQRNEWG